MKNVPFLFWIIIVSLLVFGGTKYYELFRQNKALKAEVASLRVQVSSVEKIDGAQVSVQKKTVYIDLSEKRKKEIMSQYQLEIDQLNNIIQSLREENVVVQYKERSVEKPVPVETICPGHPWSVEFETDLVPQVFKAELMYKRVGLSLDNRGKLWLGYRVY